MAEAILDTGNQMYYHTGCSPKDPEGELQAVQVDGLFCDGCGHIIEEEDEEAAGELEEEED